MADDLWGNLDIDHEMRVPLTILKEQASILSTRTNGLVEGMVDFQNDIDNEVLFIDLWLVAPALNNYRIRIVRVKHPVPLYPLEIARPGIWDWKKCDNESEFVERLHDILKSEETHRLVRALVAQSKAT